MYFMARYMVKWQEGKGPNSFSLAFIYYRLGRVFRMHPLTLLMADTTIGDRQPDRAIHRLLLSGLNAYIFLNLHLK